MTTQQFPVLDEGPRKVTIGAGTAIKVGFFFAFGATLFSIVISIIVGVIIAVLGIGLTPELHRIFGG